MDNPEISSHLTNRKTNHDRIWVVVVILLLAAISVLLQIRWSPSNHKIHVDGTVFAYGGERILNGNILEPGAVGFIHVPIDPVPHGKNAIGTIMLCTGDHLGGDCLTKTIYFLVQ